MAGNKYVFSLFNNRFALLFDCHSGKSGCTANWPIWKKPYHHMWTPSSFFAVTAKRPLRQKTVSC